MAKLLLTVEEACDVVGLKRSKLYELITAGQIESVLIGRSRRIPHEACLEFVERLRVEARESA